MKMFSAEEQRTICDAARSDEFFARIALRTAIERLRSRGSLDAALSDLLADALESALKNPKKAASAFGLVRGRGRPRGFGRKSRTATSDQHSASDLEIAWETFHKLSQGMPQRDNNKQSSGAFDEVAAQFGLSWKTVRRIWKEYAADGWCGPPSTPRRSGKKQGQ